MPTTSSRQPRLRIARPSLGASRTDTAEAIAVPTENGIVVSPECSAVKPSPICKNSEKVRKNAATPEKNTTFSSRPLTNARSPNRPSTTSGELSLRFLRGHEQECPDRPAKVAVLY